MKRAVMTIALGIYRRSSVVRLTYRSARVVLCRYRLKRLAEQRLAEKRPLKVVLGAKGKFQDEWIPTEIYTLNMLKPDDWKRYFPDEAIDALLAEHVWEHLTREEGILAAKMCFRYLKSGGYLRVAVPDGFFPDPKYIEFVKPGGVGPSAYDHKVLYDYNTLREVFELTGFKVELLEYFDEKGEFHYKEWDPDGGMIIRSVRYYDGHRFGKFKYRSLILDARK